MSDHEPAVFLGRGAAYLQLGKYEDAQKDLEQAILLNREFVPAYNKLAEVFSARKNQALAALNRGRAYFYSHEYPRATGEFERAAELQPKLAAAHLELGRSKSAEAILRVSAATESAYLMQTTSAQEDNKIQRAASDARDRFAKPAVTSLKEATRLAPTDPNAWLELGRAYFFWDRMSAIAAFEHVLQLDPKSADAHFWLGVTKYTWGDERETWREGSREKFIAQLALKDLNTAIELDPRQAGAYYFRANVHRRFELYQDAVDDLTAATTLALPSQRYLEYAAILYSPPKRLSRNVSDVPDELLSVSLKAAAYAQRAQCNTEKGEYDAAMTDLGQAIRVLPTEPKLFHLRALVHSKAKRPDADLADLRRAAQLAPGDKHYAKMVEETLKDRARIKGSELSFWEKAVLAMGTAIVLEAGIEMLSGDNRSSTGIGSADAAPRRRDCPACGGRGLFFTTVGLKTCGRCGGTGQY